MLDLVLPATVTDLLNHTMMFRYDLKGNLTTLTVNAEGQPLTINDPLNNITTNVRMYSVR